MDIPILLTAFISFITFIVLQIVVFRWIPRQQVLSGMVIVFVVAGLIINTTVLFIVSFSVWNEVVFLLGSSWLLYGFAALIYILAVFGIIESSIRIRLLGEIVRIGKKGITLKELYRKYNRDTIVSKRLERFLASGDIIFDGKNYHVGSRFSAFFLPGSIFALLWKLYRG